MSVSPPITERVSAMSRSPPVKNEPCPSIPKWMSTVPTMPTIGSLSMAMSYRSPIVGSIMNAGPAFHGLVRRSPMIRWWPVIPLWFGNAPVPIVA